MIIAEVGNNHFGDLELAIDYIKKCKELDVTNVKFQALDKNFVETNKLSMPNSFYEMCRFTFLEYLNLINQGNQLGVNVFYSIFGDDNNGLKEYQKFNKYSAMQIAKIYIYNQLDDINYNPKNIISVDEETISTLMYSKIELKNINIMYASKYHEQSPRIKYNLEKLRMNNPSCNIGYSDHTLGIDNVKRAIDLGVDLIEVHVTDKKDKIYEGQIFRDTIFGKTFDQLNEIKNYFK